MDKCIHDETISPMQKATQMRKTQCALFDLQRDSLKVASIGIVLQLIMPKKSLFCLKMADNLDR